MQDKTAAQAEMLANRLQKCFRHLIKWAKRKGIGAFRLYDRDIPEIPLVLDYYGDCGAPDEAILCGALYKRPYEKNADEENEWLSAMKKSAASSLGVNHENIFLKQRERQKGLSQYEKISKAGFEKTVQESDLFFKVNLSDYLDTGLFIDRRMLRAIIREESSGKKVLNLFSYTGSFSVCAAAGGAVSTDSVDLSNTYLEWACENFLLNGFTADFLKKSSHSGTETQRIQKENDKKINTHKLIRDDVINFLGNTAKEKKQWDIIIADPPAFSNSKKMTDDFDLNRDLISLLFQCVQLLAPNGKIFTSVNLHRKAPSAEKLEEELRGLSENSRSLRVTDLTKRITDEDFKGKKIPKAFLITNK